MYWHCIVKYPFGGYCNGTPEWDKEPEKAGEGFLRNGVCKLSPDKCGKYQRLEDQISPEELERTLHSNYVQTIVPVEKPEEKEKKHLSKKAKKLQEEMAQRSMF